MFFVVMGLCYCLNAQDYKVVSVEHLSNDFSARDEMMTDENGRQCAMLRIATKDLTPEQRNGFFFECDFASYVVERRIMDGEIWLWVSPGLKTLKITHKDLGRYELHMTTTGVGTIQPLNVYKVLIQGTFNSGLEVKAKPKKQYLAFQITPANATLEVNDRIWEVDADGIAQEYVDFGTYTWRVQALNYHTDTGSVTVDDLDKTKFVTVTLNPNYGWIEVDGKGDLRDARVYIDNILIGKAPCKSDALKSGQYTVRIAKKMFDSFSETVIVRDNETTRLAPALKADYAEVTLKVDGDAEIWVNDELKAVGSWKGQLGRGVYKMECKKANHETSLTSQEITPAMNGQTINLPAPNPIYGSLMVESTPRICKLYIDGVDMGTTPKSINEILVGRHEVKLTKEGYADYEETITINQGEKEQVKASMKKSGNQVKPVTKQENEGKEVLIPTSAKKKHGYFWGGNLGVGRVYFGDYIFNLGLDMVFPSNYRTQFGVFSSSGIVYDGYMPTFKIDFGCNIFVNCNDNKLLMFGLGSGFMDYEYSTKHVLPEIDYIEGGFRVGIGYKSFYVMGELYTTFVAPGTDVSNMVDDYSGIVLHFGYRFK